jgi:hypothetical protein
MAHTKNEIDKANAAIAELGVSPDAPVTWMALTLAAQEIAKTIRDLDRRIERLESRDLKPRIAR